MAASSSTLVQQQFSAALTVAINEAIAGIYDTQITLIQYPAQGDFLWNYENQNLVFNQGTFDYISAKVSPGQVSGTAQLSPSGGFVNAYVQIIAKLIYTLSTTDQASVNTASQNASVEASTIVTDYQTSFGQITTVNIQTAQQACGTDAVQTKLDYVIAYVLGYLWSGQQAANQPPLTYVEMATAPNLTALLPQMPTTGSQVVTDVSAYLKLMQRVVTLQSQVQLGGWTIAQLNANSGAPTDANGGMKTVNPGTGAVSSTDQVGYGINRSLSDIQSDLNNAQRILKVTVPAPTGNGSEQSITLEYPGYTLVPITPTAWQQASNVGWYAGGPIAEAFANGKQNVTGFKFVSNPGYNLNSLAGGGNFGQLTNLLISNYPTVTINYSNAAPKALNANWSEMVSDTLTVFGLQLGDPSRVTYSSSSQPQNLGAQNLGARNLESVDASPNLEGGYSTTFLPQVVPVPQMQQTAYVIGGTFDFPAQDQPPMVTQMLAQLKLGRTLPSRVAS